MSKLMFAPLAALLLFAAGDASTPLLAKAQTPAGTQTGAPYTGPQVYLSSPVTSMLVDRGKQLTFSIDVNNKSNAPKFVNLELVKAPEGWSPVLKDRGFVTRAVYVRPDGLESVDLQVKVPAEVKPQDYEFIIRGTGEGFDPSTLRLLVGVNEQPSAGSSLVVQYPELRGKTGTSFSFKGDLKNDSEAEVSYGLSYKAPERWEVTFKPSFEQTQITNVKVKSASTQGLDIAVTPPIRTAAGEYPITVTATAGTQRIEVPLKVIVTGSFEMTMTTRTDRFNTESTAGQESPFYVIINNIGSGPMENVSLGSTKPQGWAVTFRPDKIDTLEPGAQREVAMMIKPQSNAIAGDYMLNVTASHPQISIDRDVRVTVNTPTEWGLVGVAILVVVIGGLMGLYWKLGRR